MALGDLPDMNALSPRACGPWASGIHIRQIPVVYHDYHTTFQHHYSYLTIKKQIYTVQHSRSLLATVYSNKFTIIQ